MTDGDNRDRNGSSARRATLEPRPAGIALSEGVRRVAACDLNVVPGRWPYADDNADAIERLWQQRHAERPRLFDGRIFLLRDAAIAHDRLTASFIETRFSCYLHWREAGFPEAGVRDAFGSALIRSAEGHLLFGRQRPGHVNAGLVYPPSGFIDPQDVAADGVLDIAASVTRELAEETGLGAMDVAACGGFWLSVTGAQVAMAREFRSTLPAAELVARIARGLAAEPDPELAEMVVIRTPADLEPASPEYGRLLARAVLAGDDAGR